MASGWPRLLLAAGLLAFFASGCTTSDVSWDQEQYSKAQSQKQLISYLKLPLERRQVLGRLGSPAMRLEETAPLFAGVSHRTLLITCGGMLHEVSKSFGEQEQALLDACADGLKTATNTAEYLGWQTGPKEITRVILFGGRAVASDVLYLPELIYADQGPWITKPVDEAIRTGARVEALQPILGNPAGSQPNPEKPSETVSGYLKDGVYAIVGVESGRITKVISLRWASDRQIGGRPDVLMAQFTAFKSQEPTTEVLESAFEKLTASSPDSGNGGLATLQLIWGDDFAKRFRSAMTAISVGDRLGAIAILRTGARPESGN